MSSELAAFADHAASFGAVPAHVVAVAFAPGISVATDEPVVRYAASAYVGILAVPENVDAAVAFGAAPGPAVAVAVAVAHGSSAAASAVELIGVDHPTLLVD